MKKLFYCSFLLLMINIQFSWAQSVAINTDGTTANTSALLDVKSTDKGMLIPRMSKAQKNAIISPAAGLLVFQNAPDSIGFYYYNGTSWLWLATANQQDTSAWRTRGNAGSSPLNHFFGTTDNVPLSFRQNNRWAGRWNYNLSNYFIGDSAGIKNNLGINNTGFGYQALKENTNGSENLAIGSQALTNNTTGNRNTAFGALALYTQSFDPGFTYSADNTAVGNSAMYFTQPTTSTNGVKNVAVGNDAMYFNTTGYENTVIGVSALRNNISGYGNVAVGRSANRLASSGRYNSYVGYVAGFSDSVGEFNTGVGYAALSNMVYNGESYNTAIGAVALEQDSIGIYNTAVGVSALRRNKLGNNNTSIGVNAGYYTSRSRNTFVGAYAGYGERVNGGSPLADSSINNTGIGEHAMFSIANGSSNVAVGYNALYRDSSGMNNTAIGRSSLVDVTTGSNNTGLGYLTEVSSGDLENTTTVGARAYVTQSNSLILGSISGQNGATANTSVGIGTTAPTARLDVDANFKLGANGTVLNEVIKTTVAYNIGNLVAGDVELATFAVAGTSTGSSVLISPAATLPDGISISYARVSPAGTVEVKFVNAGTVTQNPVNMNFYITVIR